MHPTKFGDCNPRCKYHHGGVSIPPFPLLSHPRLSTYIPGRQTYDPDAYNSLPTLSVGAQSFQDKGARNVLRSDIRDLFLRRGVHKRYGIALLHRHFPIATTQRLVDYRNVSAPWEADGNADRIVPKYQGAIVPRSYRLFRDSFMPYEFDFAEVEESSHPALQGTRDAEFLTELSALLEQHGLEDVLGLRILDGRDSELSVEVTEGRANIMLPRRAFEPESLIEALWVFGPELVDACHCKSYCVVGRWSHTGDSGHGCS